ncbi:MAG TPA: molybdopterin-binding protein [Candidatus Limnocylindria bacterium]|nr:molybdopterin-binding protein [Candidatus Limnocylindria bacterium]
MSIAPRALVLSIGAELLLGETVDTNAAFLAAELARIGLDLRSVRQLPDDRAVIAAALRQALGQAEVVLATGGLGPTHDDVTRESMADMLGEELTEDAVLAERLLARFGGAGRMPVSNLRQALLVPSARPLDNPIGSAPGWWVERDGRVAVLMPGVPSEMRRMWTEQVVPGLRAAFSLWPLHGRTVKTFGIGESAAAEKVGELLSSPGEGIGAGIYARDDGVHLRFSTRGDAAALAELAARAVAALGEDVYGTDEQTLPGQALAILWSAGARTLATVESGTDGALLAILAGHPPAQDEARFVGGSLAVDEAAQPAAPAADALLSVRLAPVAASGRSRVAVGLEAPEIGFAERELRIHGSGPQRHRRAAFAALDQVRRAPRSGRTV